MAKDSLNIIQITTHDTGRHFGCYGHPTLHTPAVDGLASDGVRLSNLFCPVPICSPSRTSMLTGLYPQQHGQMDLAPFGWRLSDPSLHMSRRLGHAGYHTALFGVQHEVVPKELDVLGFDTLFEPPGGSNAVDVADGVVEFLNSPDKPPEPFYLQVGFRETHTPFDINGAQPDDQRGVEVPPYMADDEGNRERMAAFQGAVRMVDQAVGRIVEGLAASGLEDNTLLVVTTDHGIEMPRAKWHLYDPGIAIAMVMRCPALHLTGGRTFEGLMSNIDYLPTVFDWMDLPAGEVAGRSFADALAGGDGAKGHDAIFAMFGKRSHPRCIRTESYKLIRHFDAFGVNAPPIRFGTDMQKTVGKLVELYDLEADPNEFVNRAGQAEYQAIQADLQGRLWRWMESVGDPLLEGPVVSPSYQLAMEDYARWKG